MMPVMKMIRFAVFWEYIWKKPLTPNTTKVLKIKKTTTSEKNVNPKKVWFTSATEPVEERVLLILLTIITEIINTTKIHFISAATILDNMISIFLVLLCFM